ncbi:hypothetical protein JCM16303_000153 [Sporobolomyces ruberrimus]
MARRKSKFMDQDSDSDSNDSNDQDDEYLNPNDDEDHIVPPPTSMRGKKRTREQLVEDATYGIWAQEGDERSTSRTATGKRKDYLAGQSFVAAGTRSDSNSLSKANAPPVVDNLATALAIEEAKEDEEDVAMELDSSDEESQQEEPRDEQQEEEEEEEETDLAPIPGIDPPRQAAAAETSSTTTEQETRDETINSLGFAPRGLGARRGGGGIGSRGTSSGGIGARAGIGGGARTGGIASMAMFAAATSASDSNSTKPPAPPTTTSTNDSTPSPSVSGASTPRTGLGAGSRNGIGSRPSSSLVDTLRAELNGNPPSSSDSPAQLLPPPRQPPAAVPRPDPTPSTSSVPAPSSSSGTRRSFLPSAPPSSSKPTPKPLSRAEHLHFNSLRTTNSIGLKLLEKMGWSASTGTGLGKDGTGIVVPLGEGQKVRKKGEGIKGGERTKASWEEEARRKGISVKELMGIDKEEEGKELGKREKKKEKHKEAWAGEGTAGDKGRNKREKKVKTEFKTYEEILAENGVTDEGDRPRELLVDLAGNALPDQTITSSLPAYGAGSADPTRLPELRHNLVLLTSTLSSNLRALAKEGAGVIERRKYLLAEEERVRKGVERQETKMKRLEGILEVVGKVKEKEGEVRDLMSMLQEGEEMSMVLEKFKDEFDELLGGYEEEYLEMRLDEVVVGAITPVCRRIFQTWEPLTNPSLGVAQLKRYRKHFLIDKHLASQPPSSSVDLYGTGREEEEAISSRRRQKMDAERVMTAFESFMWTVWLPKIRSAINNDWSPSNPSPAVELFSAWSPLLPAFLRDNILDQLVLPKLSASISDWSSSAYKRGQAPGLHTIVFPWLEVAGEERMGGLLEECKRRVRTWVKNGWKAKEGVPQGLEVWKDAFTRSDWDTLLLQHVLPSLGTLLRDKLVINPRAQDLQPLESVLAWQPLLRSTMLSQLIESEFFPKWGEALWVWLKSDGVNLEQVAEWYSWWKSYFPEDVVALSGVSRGFRKGLDLMNQAMALGEDVKYRLKKPDFRPKQSSSSSTSSRKANSSSLPSSTTTKPTAPVTTEISFRSIVEDLCSSSNLLFLSTGRTTSKGQNLYRVSENVDGKGGLLCYLEDDVVWVVPSGKMGGEGEAEPVGIEEMIKRAKGGK